MSKAKISNLAAVKAARKTYFRCAYCGARIEDEESFTIDHIEAYSKTGDNSTENHFLCCSNCNCLKADLDIEQFREKLSTFTIEKVMRNADIRALFRLGVLKLQEKPVRFFYEKLNDSDFSDGFESLLDNINNSEDVFEIGKEIVEER